MSVKRLAVLLLAPLAGSAAHAQASAPQSQSQSLAAIRVAAVAALRAQLDPALAGVELEAAAIDARLRLAPCPRRLDAQAPLPRGGQSRVLVRVACTEGATWSVNVPVEISRHADVLVMRRAAARGESLGINDVITQSRRLPGLGSPFVGSVAELKGRLTRRPIPAGAAIPADALDAAWVVHRGQTVTLTAMTAGIEVRAPGLALADAAANQRVRVQNRYSLKIVEGVADTDGVVRVSP
jgi:flagellar basal body P-ring formation protein FlgA